MDRHVSERGPTGPVASGELEQVTRARHQLSTGLHRLAHDCERLLADLNRPTHHAWREHAGRAMVQARYLVTLVAPSNHVTDARALEELQSALRAPLKEVADALTRLLAMIATDLEEELVLQDARVAREGAAALLAAGGFRAGAPQAAPAAGASAAAAEQHVAGAARVLVVDDDELLREQLAMVLERLGHSVIMAENGRAGLEAAERDAPDLVITDLSMPGMDGFELLERLKAGTRTQHIPVIVVSGEGDAASVVRCLERGAEDHLTKPYEAMVLAARIRTSLERKRLRDLELAYLHRVAELTAAAEAVETQTYDPKLLTDLLARQDQLGKLARVFDRMVRGIRSREEQLQARLRGLRREMEQSDVSVAAEVTEPKPAAVNRVIAGRYQVHRELGAGGMGTVFLAHDRELGEDVALKVLHAGLLAEDPLRLERLRSEIKLARKISHPNVVRSHDIGEWEGTHYITMEFIRGVTVADLLERRGRLTVESTLAIGTQLADALAVAHDQDIVHRDIKPQNLMIDESGVLKVADFGLARTVQRTKALTQAGYVIGTVRYMAPEQLLGGDLDARTDLYAVGLVLFECLTGRLPFEASSPMALLAELMEQKVPDVSTMASDTPPALGAVINRLLEREPEKRFASARELSEALAHVHPGT
ncbi:MAG: protein kinase domain-containing protein [Gemmatimonadota bacterium]